MEIHGSFKINPVQLIMSNHGLGDMGPVQKYIDEQCIKLMEPYTPFLNGFLSGPAITAHTIIGSGTIRQVAPQARYLYHGEVYGPNYPIIKGGVLEGFYSPSKKHPTGRDIKYNKSTHPLAGKLWFERMKSDHADDILRGARKIAGGR